MPEQYSQEEADICAAVFFDAAYATRNKTYETLSALWLMAAAAGQGVDTGKYKGLIKNQIELTSWGPDVTRFYRDHCLSRTKDMGDPKIYVKHQDSAAQ